MNVVVCAGVVSTLAGSTSSGLVNGAGTLARFNQPYSLDLDSAGVMLFVSDRGNGDIRMINVVTGVTHLYF